MLRHQLPVNSPLRARGLASGLAHMVSGALAPGGRRAQLAARIAAVAGARRSLLTDSGTAALTLALRMVAARGPVAFPGYGCIDLAAAAEKSGVRVRLYDVDPRTLSADLASLERALASGARSVLVAHLYGLPADMPAILQIAARFDAPVLEDAAQAAGAMIDGRPAGTFGALVVRSFGRGKGTSGGRGGALLGLDARYDEALDDAARVLGAPRPGLAVLASTAAQWMLGRPEIYGVPARIPGLRLGEMVYHPAAEPTAMTDAAVGLLEDALTLDAAAVASRRQRADSYAQALAALPSLQCMHPARGVSGWLRYPVLDLAPDVRPAPALGVLRAYPCTLAAMAPLAPLLEGTLPVLPGAVELATRLLTLPTHHLLTDADARRVLAHFGAAGA